MTKEEKRKFDVMAKIVKAMSHPTRLFIVDKLREREHCVCELTEMIGSDISTVSRHLAVLRNAGIICDEKVKNNVFYSLRCLCVIDFFQCVVNVIKAQHDDVQL
ncbi:MAG: transcriptional regulator [Candidatus Cloacimonetes bacterium 4572_65]|nr:MAG: transcriptional regulator [Candidatus Cloacimonetes bacterium 4572_65]